MKLYISDLDGTLIDKSLKINEESKNLLNRAIKDGKLFTIATARSAATAIKIIEEININIPVILMNGSALFDLKTHTYTVKNIIDKECVIKVLDICKKTGTSGFMFSIEDDMVYVFHDELRNPNEKEYYSQRTNKPFKKFIKTDDYYKHIDKDIIYFSFIGEFDPLNQIRLLIKDIDGLNNTMYEDHFTHTFYLEIFSHNASKSKTAFYLKKLLNAAEIVAFGDNHNDKDLLEISDFAVSVSNGVEEIKKISDLVLNNDNFNAVAKYIVEN